MVTPQWGTFQKPNQVPEMSNPEERNELKEFEEEIPGKSQDDLQPEPQKPEWGNFQTPETFQGDPEVDENEESFLQMVGRNAISNALRVTEKVAGTLGDIEKFTKDALSNVPETGGFIGNAISQWIGKERWERMIRGIPGQERQIFPTSEQFKKASEAITGDYSKPKSKQEKKFHDLSEDIGSALGGAATFGGAVNYRNILVTPAAANATKEIVEGFGFGEDNANLAKMAVWLPLSLAFNVNAPREASRMMNQGRQGIPDTVQSNVSRLEQRLTDLERSPLMQSADPRSDLARQQIGRIRNDLANGQTSVRSLMTTYDGVNAAKRSKGLFDLSRTDRKFATSRINEVNKVIRDEIQNSSNSYPEAFQNWQNGVRAWATVHQSNAISSWVEGLARGPYSKLLSGPTAALFGVGSYGAAIKSPLIGGAASVAVPAVYKSGQVLYRMWNNPDLAKYYWNTISSAQAQNVPAFISNYEKFERLVEKSNPVKKNTKTKK